MPRAIHSTKFIQKKKRKKKKEITITSLISEMQNSNRKGIELAAGEKSYQAGQFAGTADSAAAPSSTLS